MVSLVRHAVLESGPTTLNLHAAPYDLEKSFLESFDVSQRRVDVDNRWVEGSFTISSVRENVKEQLAVWVEADTHRDMDEANRVLMDCMDRRRWTLTVTDLENGVPTVQQVFTCMSADYSWSSAQEYRYARMGLLKAQVPRLPTVAVTYL